MAPLENSNSARSSAMVVSVVFALPHTVWQRNISLADGSTVADALTASGFFTAFPEFSLERIHTGIYGRICELHHPLRAYDRVEIYRKLVFDPMESRRRRAHHKQRKAKQKAAKKQ